MSHGDSALWLASKLLVNNPTHDPSCSPLFFFFTNILLKSKGLELLIRTPSSSETTLFPDAFSPFSNSHPRVEHHRQPRPIRRMHPDNCLGFLANPGQIKAIFIFAESGSLAPEGALLPSARKY
jgi:hypothetical protein